MNKIIKRKKVVIREKENINRKKERKKKEREIEKEREREGEREIVETRLQTAVLQLFSLTLMSQFICPLVLLPYLSLSFFIHSFILSAC